MELIVDLHLHSKYAYATSPDMDLSTMYKLGKIKGINVIGTGDFTHPTWFSELSAKLEPAEPGLFKLREEFAKEQDKLLPESCKNNLIRFILTVEVSNIYRRHDKMRKVHNCIVVPDLKTGAKINDQLSKIGNLKSDGRPILGMDSYDLLDITVKTNPDNLFFPAHIWTPWFGMFGSKGGFNSIEEAFGNLSHEIKAVETGLSADPFMNWRLKQLDGVTVISNSDAHSAGKLAREANIIEVEELNYLEIINAIKTGDNRFVGTIEFFPEEGKYHLDGHRTCKFSCMPSTTKELDGICPICKKPLIIGVQNRVNELANRDENYEPQKHKKVEYIIPLIEIIAEIKGVKNTNSKTVVNEYERAYSMIGSEFDILRKLPIKTIKDAGFIELADAVGRMRRKNVYLQAGYDGLYGVVKVYDEKVKRTAIGQLGLI